MNLPFIKSSKRVLFGGHRMPLVYVDQRAHEQLVAHDVFDGIVLLAAGRFGVGYQRFHSSLRGRTLTKWMHVLYRPRSQ